MKSYPQNAFAPRSWCFLIACSIMLNGTTFAADEDVFETPPSSPSATAKKAVRVNVICSPVVMNSKRPHTFHTDGTNVYFFKEGKRTRCRRVFAGTLEGKKTTGLVFKHGKANVNTDTLRPITLKEAQKMLGVSTAPSAATTTPDSGPVEPAAAPPAVPTTHWKKYVNVDGNLVYYQVASPDATTYIARPIYSATGDDHIQLTRSSAANLLPKETIDATYDDVKKHFASMHPERAEQFCTRVPGREARKRWYGLKDGKWYILKRNRPTAPLGSDLLCSDLLCSDTDIGTHTSQPRGRGGFYRLHARAASIDELPKTKTPPKTVTPAPDTTAPPAPKGSWHMSGRQAVGTVLTTILAVIAAGWARVRMVPGLNKLATQSPNATTRSIEARAADKRALDELNAVDRMLVKSVRAFRAAGHDVGSFGSRNWHTFSQWFARNVLRKANA